MTEIITPQRLARLPLWAQRHIAHLEEGYNVVEDTQVTWRLLFGQLGPGEHCLPNEAVVRFNLRGRGIEFTLIDDGVRVYTYHGRPTVQVRASNELVISVE